MNINLFLDKIYWAFIKKSKIKNNTKSYEYWLSKGYNNTPEVSFIIQSHNKSLQIKHIVNKLRARENAEIIVIDDGSDLNHINTLSTFMDRANEFVIRANDLYEIVMYDKAIRFSNGKYIVLLQDDDDFDDLSWVEEGISYFRKYPLLVILGGNNMLSFKINEEKQLGIGVPYDQQPKEGFNFAHHVDRAPMWLNRSLFESKLKHIDFTFAPFQFDDCELCLRAWLNGLQVGWYKTNFTSLTAGGMRIWNTSFTGTQCQRNASRLYSMYKDRVDEINRFVYKAKNEHC